MLKTKNGIMIATPDVEIENILTFTTCKYGGFSKGYFAHLNMGFGVDEDIDIVKANHNLVKSTFNINYVVTVKQVHGNKIINVNKDNYEIIEADGIFTVESKLPLGIMTADCYNVQLIGEKGIANLHCGWRSIYSGIIHKARYMFDSISDKIKHAIVGIGICEKCYAVNKELAERFYEKFGVEIIKDENNKYFLDLRKIIVQNLLKSGINNILNVNYCSKCNSFLYSHRRDKGKTGRMMSVLMKK